MLLKIKTLDALSEAMRLAGLGSSNLIFGKLPLTPSAIGRHLIKELTTRLATSTKAKGIHNKLIREDNKYRSFDGRSLHSVEDPSVENPYQQVIKVISKTLAPFATDNGIPVSAFLQRSYKDVE